jgi:two-component system invasion response regulator UvrY
MKKTTIFLADDHTIMVDGLENMIEKFGGFEVVGSGANGHDVFAALKKGPRPDIIILDLNMPVMDGYETAKKLKEDFPAIKTVILSMYDSEVSVIRLLQLGVKAILNKTISNKMLQEALVTVSRGGVYFCPGNTLQIATFFDKHGRSGPAFDKAIFSDKEIKFINLCASDTPYKQAADGLGLNSGSIDNLRVTVFKKAGVKAKVDLIMFAVKNGIVKF